MSYMFCYNPCSPCFQDAASSSDYADVLMNDIFPVSYSFVGSEGDISRDLPVAELIRTMLRTIEPNALKAMRQIAHTNFKQAMTFLAAYDMDISTVTDSPNLMASLTALQAFHKKKMQEVRRRRRRLWNHSLLFDQS